MQEQKDIVGLFISCLIVKPKTVNAVQLLNGKAKSGHIKKIIKVGLNIGHGHVRTYRYQFI